MKKSPLQFSLAALLLTVAVVANVLWLIIEAPPDLARMVSVAAIVVLAALCITGTISGRSMLRTFCVGALIPLAMMLLFIAMNLGDLINVFAGNERLNTYSNPAYVPSTIAFTVAPRFFGVGILLSIALGYLCVGFRWLIERREG